MLFQYQIHSAELSLWLAVSSVRADVGYGGLLVQNGAAAESAVLFILSVELSKKVTKTLFELGFTRAVTL